MRGGGCHARRHDDRRQLASARTLDQSAGTPAGTNPRPSSELSNEGAGQMPPEGTAAVRRAVDRAEGRRIGCVLPLNAQTSPEPLLRSAGVEHVPAYVRADGPPAKKAVNKCCRKPSRLRP